VPTNRCEGQPDESKLVSDGANGCGRLRCIHRDVRCGRTGAPRASRSAAVRLLVGRRPGKQDQAALCAWGRAPSVILIHGVPPDWAEYQAIMPRLANGFTVVSAKADYDNLREELKVVKVNQAAEIEELRRESTT